jgi:hypothetical protein
MKTLQGPGTVLREVINHIRGVHDRIDASGNPNQAPVHGQTHNPEPEQARKVKAALMEAVALLEATAADL